MREAGTSLAEDWLSTHLHRLKHDGPARVVKTVQALRDQHPDLEQAQEHVAYLEKRQAQMHYPRYQQQQWPIGSGMVESAHKQVVQSRFNGAGMRWGPEQVNPMLALRTVVCNDRWDEAWDERSQFLQQHRTQRYARTEHRLAQHACRLLVTLLLHAWAAPSLVPAPVHTAPPPGPPRPTPRPFVSHPWRRRCLPCRHAG